MPISSVPNPTATCAARPFGGSAVSECCSWLTPKAPNNIRLTRQGFGVDAFEISEVGVRKAVRLAALIGVGGTQPDFLTVST